MDRAIPLGSAGSLQTYIRSLSIHRPAMQSSVQAYIADVLEQRQELANDARLVIGISGPPGSGKSTFTEQVARGINQTGLARTIVISMDGWHLSRAQVS